jgi:hypothetical protein
MRAPTTTILVVLAACGGGNDDRQPAIDAAGTIDGGTVDAAALGLDSPCCVPDQLCPAGFVCLADAAGVKRCRNLCTGPDADECPEGGVCASFAPGATVDAAPEDPAPMWSVVQCGAPIPDAGLENVPICIPAAGEGDDCAPELCSQGTVCVGDSAQTATCLRRCLKQGDCDEGTTCMEIPGAEPSMACFP